MAISTTHRLRPIFLLLAALWLVSSTMAQTVTTSIADGTTPPSIQAGAPEGSYALSGFETVNIFNGNLDVRLPLYKVGGRGTAGYTIYLPIEQRWIVQHRETPTTQTDVPMATDSISGSMFGHAWFLRYSPGTLVGRYVRDVSGDTPCPAPNSSISILNTVLTRITWIEGDGTEHELRDQISGGQPVVSTAGQSACSSSPPLGTARGSAFTSADGTSLTFIADSPPIYDPVRTLDLGSGTFSPSGWLLFPNGNRFRISNGRVTIIEDRNGNITTLNFTSAGGTVTDPLGRVITVTYADGTSTFSDTIQFPGFQGTPRTITVNYGNLHNYLAAGQAPTTYFCLFPELNGSSGTPPDPLVVSSVQLPNGKSYSFQYNSYFELAQIALPTGGAIQYTYPQASNCTAGNDGVVPVQDGTGANNYAIYRYVSQRVVLPDGVTPEGITVFTPEYHPAGYDSRYPSRAVTAVTVDHKNAAGTVLLARDKHYFFGDLSSPDSYMGAPNIFYPKWASGREYLTEEYTNLQTTPSVLRSTRNTWGQRACNMGTLDQPCFFADPQSDTSSAGITPSRDTEMCGTAATLDGQLSARFFKYDMYANRTDVYEYDFGVEPVTTGACPAAAPAGFLRQKSTQYKADGVYDVYNTSAPAQSIYLRALPVLTQVLDSSANPQSKTEYFYDETAMSDASGISGHDSSYGTSHQTGRGNLTTVHQWTTSSGYITTTRAYDIAGNVVSATDGNAKLTTFTFNGPDYAFLRMVSKTVGAKTLQFSRGYDGSTGQVTSFSDPNSKITTYSAIPAGGTTPDALDRLSLVTRPDGGRTQFSYDDANVVVTTTSDQVSADGKVVSQVLFDGLGRQKQTRQFEDSNTAGTNYIAMDTVYDGMGRTYQVSLPHRANSAAHWDTTAYDSLSRVLSVTTDDGAATSTSYSANVTTVQDQACAAPSASVACNMRSTTTDAMQRLISVTEAGSITTNYQYNLNDDLTAVCQGGSFNSSGACVGGQPRSLTYDWLSRLTSATNPETSAVNQASGTINYSQYDGNGNLLTKSDMRGITTTMTYDEWNRIRTRTYSDGLTQAVTYCYDGTVAAAGGVNCVDATPAIPNALGHLTQLYSSASTMTYSAYDVMGRVALSSQNTPSSAATPYNFGTGLSDPGYVYNLAGQLTSVKYPSGRVVALDYDAAGRIAKVRNPSSGLVYGDVSLFNPSTQQYAYAPQGAIQTMTLGNNVVESTTWDAVRLQPTQFQADSLLTLQYYYCPNGGTGCNTNNGNTLRQKITTPTNGPLTSGVTQDYTYTDGFNRLNSAQESNSSGQVTWSQSYQYDTYGNRAVSGYVPYPALTPSSTSQYVESIGGVPVNRNHWSLASYDNGGNMTGVPGTSRTFSYDGENRLTSSTQPNVTGPIQYAYDGEGRRVQKTVGSALTTYVYDAMGQLAAEYGPPNTTGTTYLSADTLGSTRLVVNGGTVQHYDYFPFGEDIQQGVGGRDGSYPVGAYPASGPDVQPLKFTGKERDAETGLDYFGARYYSGAQGRFTSPDWSATPQPIPYADLSDPQTLNLYSYVRNNPLSRIDPDGHYFVVGAQDQKFYQQALTDLYRRPGGRELVNSLANSDKPVLLDRGSLDTANTGQAGVTTPMAVFGEAGVAGAHVTVGTDADLMAGAKLAPGKVSADVTTGHELEHANDAITAGKSSLSAGVAAAAAGDAPSSPGAKNTIGGTAQSRAEGIMGQKTDMNKRDAAAAVQGILKSGQQQWQNESNKSAICSQNQGACR